MFSYRMAMSLAVVLLGTGVLWAQEKPVANTPVPEPSYALTIYSTADPATFDPQGAARDQAGAGYQAITFQRLPGYGVVRDQRTIDLQEGQNMVRFSDVAAGIDPTTVSFKSLAGPDAASVMEQNYEYDLVSADKLLGKYLGKTVIINRKTNADPRTGVQQYETLEGTLLAYDGGNFVLQTANKQLPVQIIPRGEGISEIKLFELQTGLITKPTLVWKVAAKQGGKQEAQVTYQTDGLTWRADYSVTLNKDDTAADVGAWVTILNQSGAAFPNAKLKLVAGDVHRLAPPQPMDLSAHEAIGGAAAVPVPEFAEKAFFEYHMYTLGRTTSLANNSTKQIELFPTRNGALVSKSYVYYGVPEQLRAIPYASPCLDRQLGAEGNKSVDIYVTLQNTQKNGLGIPLPAGRVRVYKVDQADAAQEFIGEDLIQHTPKDEDVLVKLGSAFDLVGERKQTDFEVSERDHWIREAFAIKVRNHKDAPVNVVIKENLFRWANWEISKCSEKYQKEDARTIHIPVDVQPNGEKVVTYEVKYTW